MVTARPCRFPFSDDKRQKIARLLLSLLHGVSNYIGSLHKTVFIKPSYGKPCSSEPMLLRSSGSERKSIEPLNVDLSDCEKFQQWLIKFLDLPLHRSASPQQGDLRLSSPPSGQGADGTARTRDRRVSADLMADELST
ncbi:hypothetical protein PoB_006087600 [Plakobranchus ocellatus]|uniref:Uncharacterized protein n=1 Tax=Plakobranchus ocellatus TaxID=259542 RepID=A0AAV4CR95_9GAST|nr:hypothetical protein PoB_006087600 [Plakobranchus ocellatus]